MSYAKVLKANPFHAADGRFTSEKNAVKIVGFKTRSGGGAAGGGNVSTFQLPAQPAGGGLEALLGLPSKK